MVEKVRLEFTFHLCYMVESGHTTQAQMKPKSHIYIYRDCFFGKKRFYFKNIVTRAI